MLPQGRNKPWGFFLIHSEGNKLTRHTVIYLSPLQPNTSIARVQTLAPAVGSASLKTGRVGFSGINPARYVPSKPIVMFDHLINGRVTSFFRATKEDYIAGVMAIDLIALFFPRAWKALVRSSKDYDPKKDPKAMRLTGLKEWLYIAGQRAKRLNWTNFIEEFSRELLGGPGLFLPTAILFSAFRKGYGKTATQLDGSTLKAFSEQLGDKAKVMKLDQFNEAGFKQLTHQFAKDLIDIDKLVGKDAPESLKETFKKEMGQWVDDYLTKLNSPPEGGYAGKWAFWKNKETKKAYAAWAKERDALEAGLKPIIETVRNNRPTEFWNRLARIPFLKNWKNGDKFMTASNWANRLGEWNDFTQTVKKQWRKGTHSFADSLKHVYNKMKTLKILYTGSVVIATMGALLKAVYIFQHNDEYPANSAVRLQDLNVNKKRTQSARPSRIERHDSPKIIEKSSIEEVIQRQADARRAKKLAIKLAHSNATMTTLPQVNMTTHTMPSSYPTNQANFLNKVVAFTPLTPRQIVPQPSAQWMAPPPVFYNSWPTASLPSQVQYARPYQPSVNNPWQKPRYVGGSV